jgi:uncharacterized RDD family membrane protein YckC
MSAGPETPTPDAAPTPKLRRRLASMTYEAMLLFAVVFIAGYLFDTLTQSRSALMFRHARQAWLFVVLGIYFVWFWMHGGQTLAMKTWHVRLVPAAGPPMTYGRAIGRFFLLWIFVLPTLAVVDAVGWHGWPAVGALAAALLLPPFYARFDRDRQFLHDRLAGTRIVAA